MRNKAIRRKNELIEVPLSDINSVLIFFQGAVCLAKF